MSRKSELTLRKIHVAAGILFDANGRILNTDRSRANTMQEFWEFPGGKQASGESADAALRRELAEELGIEITSFEHFCRLEHDTPESRVAIEFFLVSAWEGMPSGAEGQDLEWCMPMDVTAEMLLPADAPVLARLRLRQK